jgi:hypothetical protein
VSGADDLFSNEGPAPLADRLDRAARLAALAAVLTLLGPCCFSGVPGAAVAVFAWQMADDELARVEAGALPSDRRGRALQVRRLAFFQVAFAGVLLFVQLVLFLSGAYELAMMVILNLLGFPVQLGS